MQHNKYQGFSLLELLLVVSIGTVLLLSGISTYKILMDNLQTSQIIRLLGVVNTQIEWSYGSKNMFPDGNMLPQLVAMRIFPPETPVIGSGNDMYARLPIGIYQIEGQRQTYTVTVDSIPKPACIQIGQAYTPANNHRLLRTTVNGSNYDAKRAGTFDNFRQELLNKCVEPGNINKIEWLFR